MTNGDMIRNMSDDELAIFLNDVTAGCFHYGNDIANGVCDVKCLEKKCPLYTDQLCTSVNIKKWVKAPYHKEA